MPFLVVAGLTDKHAHRLAREIAGNFQPPKPTPCGCGTYGRRP